MTRTAIQIIRARLLREKKRRVGRDAAIALLWTLAVSSVLWGSMAFMSLRHPLHGAWLWALFGVQAASLGLIPFALWRWHKLPLSRLAEILDRYQPQAPDPFRLALGENQIPQQERAALENFLLPWVPRLTSPALKPWPTMPWIAFALGTVFFVAACLQSGNPAGFLARAILPGWQALNMPRVTFTWPSEKLSLVAGDTLRCQVRVHGAQEGQNLHALLRFDDGKAERLPLTVNQSEIVIRRADITSPLRVRLIAANGKSDWKRVALAAPPSFTRVRIRVQPPAYTRIPSRQYPEGVLSGSSPLGSLLSWRMEAPGMRRLVWMKKTALGQSIDTLEARDTVALAWTLGESLHYSFRICDAWNHCTVSPAQQLWEAIPDQAPKVAILSPREGEDLPQTLQLPLLIKAADDFGISDLRVLWSVASQEKILSSGRFPAKSWISRLNGDPVAANWDLSPLGLQSGQSLEIKAEACDNNAIRGPQCSQSSPLILRLPSLGEALAAIQGQEEGVMEKLRSAAERSQKSERKLREASGEAHREGPALLQPFDVERIMVQDPENHLQKLAAVMRPAQALGEKPSALDAALRDLALAMQKNRDALPKSGQFILPLEHQQRNLEKLIQGQKALEKAFNGALDKASEKTPEKTGKPSSDAKSPSLAASEKIKAELQSLREELARNRVNQGDLAQLLRDQAQEKAEKERQLDAALEEQRRMVEDVKSAAEGMQKSLDQSREQGMASPELARKMEKLQEMLRDLLPDSLRELLQKKAQGQEVDLEAVQKQLQEVMNNRQAFEQGLDRALAMLETLRERRRLESLRAQVADLAQRQKNLAASAAKQPHAQGLANKQESLKKEWEKLKDGFLQGEKPSPLLRPAQKAMQTNEAGEQMQKAKEAMSRAASSPASSSSSSSPSSLPASNSQPSEAGPAAEAAAQSLQSLAAGMDSLLARQEKKPKLDPQKLREWIQASLDLSRLQILARGNAGQRYLEGWVSDGESLYGAVSRASRHLETGLKQFLRGFEAGGQLILREAHALAQSAEQAYRGLSEKSGRQALAANHRLTRELLRLASLLKDSGGAGMPGMAGGEGEGSQGQGQGQGHAEGEGEGQGQGEGLGPGEVGQALAGVSGEQMAVNQATYALLKSMLEGRAPSGGQEGRGSGEEGAPSPGPSGANAGPAKAGALGNRQGEVGEDLESLAEKAGEEGGAAARLRQLAAEARALEEDIRRGRLDPDAAKFKQERFRMRLLEASKALEERGREEQREAQTFQGRMTGNSPARANPEDLRRRIEAAREKAKSLPLRDSEREVLDNFYRELLTR